MAETKKKTFPVVIPRKLVKLKRNSKGNHYFLVSVPNSTKEIYIPHAWLKLSSEGSYYKGKIEADYEIMGRKTVATKTNGEDLRGVFPSKTGSEI